MMNCLTLFITGLLVMVDSRTIDSSNLIEAIKASGKLQASKEEFPSALSVIKDINDPSNLVNINQDFVERSSRLNPEDLSRFIATQGFNLEKLLAEFAAKTANVKDYEERAAQWLRQLKLMLQLLSSGTQIDKSKRNENRLNEIGEMETALLSGNRKIISIGGNNWIDDLLEYLEEQDIEAQSSEDNESHVKSRYEDSSTSFSLTNENREEDDQNNSDRHSAEELDNMLIGVQNEIGLIRRYFEKLCSKHHSMSSSASHSENHNHERSSNIFHAKKISKV